METYQENTPPCAVLGDTCSRCGKSEEGVAFFASAYRKNEMRHGRPDPGNLCGSCAGSDAGKRVAGNVLES